MRKIVFLAVVVGFVSWRRRRLDAYDQSHGYGYHADVKPVRTD